MPEPLLPQQPTPARAEIASVEWLFEPFWPGDRLIIRIASGAGTVTDAFGEAPSDLSDVGELVRAAVRAGSAVIDGVWTAQPFLAEDPDADQRAFVAGPPGRLEGAGASHPRLILRRGNPPGRGRLACYPWTPRAIRHTIEEASPDVPASRRARIGTR